MRTLNGSTIYSSIIFFLLMAQTEMRPTGFMCHCRSFGMCASFSSFWENFSSIAPVDRDMAKFESVVRMLRCSNILWEQLRHDFHLDMRQSWLSPILICDYASRACLFARNKIIIIRIHIREVSMLVKYNFFHPLISNEIRDLARIGFFKYTFTLRAWVGCRTNDVPHPN